MSTSYSTLDGWPIYRGVVQLPYSGCWVADLHALVDSNTAIASNVELVIEDFSLHGGVFRGDTNRSDWRGRVMGGAELLQVLEPEFYQNTSVLTVVSDIATDCGVDISDFSGLPTDAQLSKWVRVRGSASQCLRQLLEPIGCVWRVSPDGSLVFPKGSTIFTGKYTELDFSPDSDTMTVILDSMKLSPGMEFAGRIVSDVTHLLEPESTRTRIQFV